MTIKIIPLATIILTESEYNEAYSDWLAVRSPISFENFVKERVVILIINRILSENDFVCSNATQDPVRQMFDTISAHLNVQPQENREAKE